MFKSKKEFAQAVIDILMEYEKSVVINPWYENIPEHGILCWVWDVDSETKRIALVNDYYKELPYPYKTSISTGWKHAEPLTEEEVKQYIYKVE